MFGLVKELGWNMHSFDKGKLTDKCKHTLEGFGPPPLVATKLQSLLYKDILFLPSPHLLPYCLPGGQ